MTSDTTAWQIWLSLLHFAPTEISLLACRGIPLADIRPTEMSVTWTSNSMMRAFQDVFSWFNLLSILGRTDHRSETVALDTETDVSSSASGECFWCCVLSQVLRSQVQCHLRHSDISLERFVRRATLICRAAENESWQCKFWRILPWLRPCNSRSVV